MKEFVVFLRNWTLPVAMTLGAVLYFIIAAIPMSAQSEALTYVVISHYVQPVLLFVMLFLAFTKVAPHDMLPHRWQIWVLVWQAGLFVAFSMLALHAGSYTVKLLFEGAMLCLICPTATAASVITGKLGGNVSGVTTYLLICNLMVSVVSPVFLTMVEPRSGLDFLTSFFMIMGKVFPLLICPLVVAWLVRFLLPEVHAWLRSMSGLAFYLWGVGLALAITVTVRSIAYSRVAVSVLLMLAAVSLVCCLLQFGIGKAIGTHYDRRYGSYPLYRITAGQAFGQKNTVFIIWLGFVFLDPVTTVVGGFYSIWHNTINSYQLYKVRRRSTSDAAEA